MGKLDTHYSSGQFLQYLAATVDRKKNPHLQIFNQHNEFKEQYFALWDSYKPRISYIEIDETLRQLVNLFLKGRIQRQRALSQLQGHQHIHKDDAYPYILLYEAATNKLSKKLAHPNRKNELSQIRLILQDLITKASPEVDELNGIRNVNFIYKTIMEKTENIENLPNFFPNLGKKLKRDLLNQVKSLPFCFTRNKKGYCIVIKHPLPKKYHTRPIKYSKETKKWTISHRRQSQYQGKSLSKVIKNCTESYKNYFLKAELDFDLFLANKTKITLDELKKLSVWHDINKKEARKLLKQENPPLFIFHRHSKNRVYLSYKNNNDELIHQKFNITWGLTSEIIRSIKDDISQFLLKRQSQLSSRFKSKVETKDYSFDIVSVKKKWNLLKEELSDENTPVILTHRDREYVVTPRNSDPLVYRLFNGKFGASSSTEYSIVGEGKFKKHKEVYDLDGGESKVIGYLNWNSRVPCQTPQFVEEIKKSNTIFLEVPIKVIDKTDKKKQFNSEISLTNQYTDNASAFIRSGVCEKIKYNLMISTAKGLKEMHDKKWIHRDIKPHNILYKGSGSRIAKLADFDTVEKITAKEPILICTGTGYYIDPNYKKGGGFIRGVDACFASDIYSLGVCFYEWHFGRTFKKEQFNEPLDLDSRERLIWDMIYQDFTQRPKIDDVINRLQLTAPISRSCSRKHS